MTIFGSLFMRVLDVFEIEFTLFGYQFSFWQVFVYLAVGGIILDFVMEAFFDD